MDGNHTRSSPYRTTRAADGSTVVTLHGELDLPAVPALSAALDDLTAVPRPDLVLDLRSVTFVDCSGLGVLCRAKSRIRGRHGRLRLVTRASAFRRLLRCTGLSDAFEVRPDLPEALADGVPTERATAARG
ncbi:STAS domain-containing protein [Streptomyces caniscabiei]|uniref:Anti-sigma factor antagonist n=1 Tax=Streptomyces caniscabiei TaxID=2746961 RepID=A0ABU4MY90_9ACTN|nr:STAS domain-containing protein [Streptomyces caniscabiei]MBE4733537.1 STAS domain-containing protein [Streptomyces caniscabiei]MBE4754714.1 STAS domain-containing protein [Streptomyces caniscabiei]MBE4768465.1 STAS domain-containing protein [Streptomyces caniscabiei]MBE4782032.1 STAS domain-containing protein [Streptomyces caniscabiei]MBE4793321.1 STAS domain-containing protein [Streptomyces caniscabiei]